MTTRRFGRCNLPVTSTQDPGAADCQELCAVVKCPCTRRWRSLVIHTCTCTGGKKNSNEKKRPSIQICKQNEHDFVFQFIAGGDDFFQKRSGVRFQKHLLNLPKFQPHSMHQCESTEKMHAIHSCLHARMINDSILK